MPQVAAPCSGAWNEVCCAWHDLLPVPSHYQQASTVFGATRESMQPSVRASLKMVQLTCSTTDRNVSIPRRTGLLLVWLELLIFLLELVTSDIWWSVVSPCDLFCSLWMTFWQTSNGTKPTSKWWTSLIGWRDIDWQLCLCDFDHHLHARTTNIIVTTVITTVALTVQPRELWYIGPVCFLVGWHKRRRERGFNFLRFILAYAVAASLIVV